LKRALSLIAALLISVTLSGCFGFVPGPSPSKSANSSAKSIISERAQQIYAASDITDVASYIASPVTVRLKVTLDGQIVEDKEEEITHEKLADDFKDGLVPRDSEDTDVDFGIMVVEVSGSTATTVLPFTVANLPLEGDITVSGNAVSTLKWINVSGEWLVEEIELSATLESTEPGGNNGGATDDETTLIQLANEIHFAPDTASVTQYIMDPVDLYMEVAIDGEVDADNVIDAPRSHAELVEEFIGGVMFPFEDDFTVESLTAEVDGSKGTTVLSFKVTDLEWNDDVYVNVVGTVTLHWERVSGAWKVSKIEMLANILPDENANEAKVYITQRAEEIYPATDLSDKLSDFQMELNTRLLIELAGEAPHDVSEIVEREKLLEFYNGGLIPVEQPGSTVTVGAMTVDVTLPTATTVQHFTISNYPMALDDGPAIIVSGSGTTTLNWRRTITWSIESVEMHVELVAQE